MACQEDQGPCAGSESDNSVLSVSDIDIVSRQIFFTSRLVLEVGMTKCLYN